MGDLMKSNSKTFHDVDIEGMAKSGARCWTHLNKVSKQRLIGAATVAGFQINHHARTDGAKLRCVYSRCIHIA